MKLTALTTAFAVMFVVQSAQAHERYYQRVARHEAKSHGFGTLSDRRFSAQQRGGHSARQAFAYAPDSGGHSQYRGRPSAWCGWEMRQLVSGDPGPEFNLARNWAHWGRSGPPGIGAIVVWSHHVGKIVGREGGEWVIESGNDDHAVRTRPRSIAGAIAIRWG